MISTHPEGLTKSCSACGLAFDVGITYGLIELNPHDRLTLRFPTEDDEQAFLCAHRATSPEVPYFLHYYSDDMRFRDYLVVLAEQKRGTNLPFRHVPSSFLFAFVGTRIVGRVDPALAQRVPREGWRAYRPSGGTVPANGWRDSSRGVGGSTQ